VVNSRHFNVLLVEDDDDTRELLRVLLECDGFEVVPARDGLEGLDRLTQLRSADPDAPCVIVLDYMMPRFSGAQFRERQLASPALADVPVIVVSAISDLKALTPLHPFAVLQKPVNPEELNAIVRKACEDLPGGH